MPLPKNILNDLARSGLTAKDAETHRIEPLSSAQTAKLTGQQVESYKLPYHTLDGKVNGFYRLRFLPSDNVVPFVRAKKARRYWQPKASGTHLYLPPCVKWSKIAQNSTQTLYITEGEKKAIALCKEGRACIGLGGVQSWRRDAAKELDSFVLRDREVVIVFDSDAAANPDVQRAENQLADDLRHAGARVYVKRLPPGKGGAKVGLDDFLLAHGVKAFDALRMIEASPTERNTDLGNARRLIRQHGADMRYAPGLGWLVWDDARWRADDNGETMRRAKDTVQAIYAEAARESDDTRRQQLAKWAASSESVNRLGAMIELARTEPGVHISVEALDADPWLLGVANGVIDLSTGRLRSACREDLITKRVPVVFDPKAECPEFKKFLHRIFNGDKNLIAYVQRAVGYSLTGDTREQCLFLLHGTGENGKSTLLNALGAVLGEYATTTPTSTLMAKNHDSIPNDIARLRGARFVDAVETEEGRRFAESLIKQLTGGDRIAGRFLHKEYFEFRPRFKLWIAANHKPTIRGDDHAIWRRIRLIPFEVQIPKREKVLNFYETKLRPELPGILRWAVEGCRQWQRDGLRPPAVVSNATDAYRQEMDALRTWIDERCETGKNKKGQAAKLYESYKQWTEACGERTLAQRDFARRMEERNFKRKREKTGWVYLGVDVQAPESKWAERRGIKK